MNFIVSVRLMCFNQESFIGKAMESILMQKTKFPVEVVVGDDFSSDGTLEIVRRYKDNDNIKIKILERKIGDDYWAKRQEKGRLYNFVNILENCSGKYIALLDGDDYWTDPNKLQRQVDFLEANLDFSCSSHSAQIITDGGKVYKQQYFKSNEVNTFEDIINNHFIPSCSFMFRNKMIELPEWYFDKRLLSGDMAIELMLAHHGKCYHLNDEMAVHLKHESGVTNSEKHRKALNRVLNKKVLYEGISEYTKGKQKSLDAKLASIYMQYSFMILQDWKFGLAAKYAFKSLVKDPMIIFKNGKNSLLVIKNLLRK